MIRLEAPPIREELFVSETFSDQEYFRAFKPKGSHYQSMDCATGLRCHCGYDMQDFIGAPLYAVADGSVHFIDKGPAFGIQSALVPTGTEEAWFYAHQNRRTVKDGTPVRAGAVIGEMGTSGGVQCHLHFGALDRMDRTCWTNGGPQLRDLKDQLLHPAPEVDVYLVRKSPNTAVYRYDGKSLTVMTDHEVHAASAGFFKVPVHIVPSTDPIWTVPTK